MIRKQGGELIIRAKASGDYNVSVYASFDNGVYNLLGTINVAGNLITFPVTFPVSFTEANIVYKKFHLDRYGEWYNIQVKLVYNDTKTDDITIIERQLLTYPAEYIHEEEN